VIRARATWRWRLTAGCVLLLGLAMTQSPGLLVADTKLDLAVAPWDFLARAAHLWDGEGAFGQLQNQAYGYLWPMGPFFALGFLFDIPGWVVQRLWMALVLCVAFVGTAKVARALGVRSHLAGILAGLAYALSPRMLTVIGPSSIEVWPMAVAPWVLLPLVVGAERGSPRLAAALSALAIAMVGGVNAAATSAVLPLGALWLLTRSAGPRRRQMMIWWPVLTLLGTLWWLVPLFLLGSYSPPFLDFIESAGITTFPTTLFDVVRGTSNWVPYVQAFSPAGDDLLRVPFLILNTGLLVVAGIAGLVLTRNSHRRFLVAGVLTGVFLVTMGHTGSVQGLFAGQLNDALDLALAPLRNVHKFDPVLRLPLAVGLAFAVEEALSRRRTRRTRSGARADRVTASVVVASVMVSLAASASLVLVGNLAVARGFEDIPEYWGDAAAWLGEEQPDGVALLIPGSSSGTYVWGEPREEPMQALASSPWAVRNAVPLVPAGNIRMLDRIEQELARGEGGPGLGDYLARAGITHLVLRNDLERSDSIVDPVLVHEAINHTPGVRRVAQFGPEVGGAPFIVGKLARALVSGGWQSTYPAVEVFEVGDPVARSSGTDAPPTVVGGPEDLLDVQAAGLIGSEAAVLAPDADEGEGRPGPLIVTDGLRSVERNFGRLTEAVSATLGAGSEPSLKARVLDYRLPGHDRWTTVARLRGASAVTATSSGAGSASPGGSRPGEQPYAAIDGDPSTSWVSAPLQAAPQSWRVEFDEPVGATDVSVTLGPSSGAEQLRLRSGSWTSPELEFNPGETRSFKGPSTVSQLVLEDVSGRPNNKLDVAEVRVGDTQVRRELMLPEVPEQWGPPDAILLRRLGDARTGCAEVDGDVRCRATEVGSPEEPRDFSRVVTLADPQELEAALAVRPRGGPELTALIQAGQAVVVEASATALTDPRASVTAMVDGDPGTSWIAPASDITPTVEMRFLAPQRVRGLGLSVDQSTAARRPERLLMTWPGGKRTVVLDKNGAATFPAIRTSRLALRVLDAEPASDFDFDGSATPVPVGISEMVLQGVPFLPLSPSTRRTDLGCGSGPDVTVNGRSVRTSVTASARELIDGAPLPAQLCGAAEVDLRAGENTVVVTASDAFVADQLVLGSARPEAARDVTTSQDSVTRTIDGVSTDYVATRENANPGWEASSGGVPLRPQVFDGWRQGWHTEGDDSVTQRFGPDGPYRAGLAAGLVAFLVLVAIALVFRRRSGPEHPPTTELAGRPVLCTLWVAGVVLLISGWAGLAVGAVGWGAAALVRWLRPSWEGWGVALCLTFPVLAYAWGPWQSSSFAGRSAWPHYAVVLTLAAASCWVATEPFPRRARDMPGRSTSQ
jgi:arabinofuranan 3-O-arabinosyltransferase